jgi:hypothetical protein
MPRKKMNTEILNTSTLEENYGQPKILIDSLIRRGQHELLKEIKQQNDELIKQARECWEKGDVFGVMSCMPYSANLAFVFDNMDSLVRMGKYEECFLRAYSRIKTNLSNWDMGALKLLFDHADKVKLRKAGDPIPEQEIFTLYRGVSGNGKQRRVHGFSWTSSPNTAAWFAKRFLDLGLSDPAVYIVTVTNGSILACLNGRNENEYLLGLPLPVKPIRLKVMPEAFLPKDEK